LVTPDTAALASDRGDKSGLGFVKMGHVIGCHCHTPEPALLDGDAVERRVETAHGVLEVCPVIGA